MIESESDHDYSDGPAQDAKHEKLQPGAAAHQVLKRIEEKRVHLSILVTNESRMRVTVEMLHLRLDRAITAASTHELTHLPVHC